MNFSNLLFLFISSVCRLFLHISNPNNLTPLSRDRETTNADATNPSIIPVGTYQNSIVGMVTMVPAQGTD